MLWLLFNSLELRNKRSCVLFEWPTKWSSSVVSGKFNPFVPNASFVYPLKTSENLKVFWRFQGVEKGCIGSKWVNKGLTFIVHNALISSMKESGKQNSGSKHACFTSWLLRNYQKLSQFLHRLHYETFCF